MLRPFVLQSVAAVVHHIATTIPLGGQLAKMFAHVVKLSLQTITLVEVAAAGREAVFSVGHLLVGGLEGVGGLLDKLFLPGDILVKAGAHRLVLFELRRTTLGMAE